MEASQKGKKLKKASASLIFLTLYSLAHGATPNGIGIFKLGMNYAEVEKWAATNEIEIGEKTIPPTNQHPSKTIREQMREQEQRKKPTIFFEKTDKSQASKASYQANFLDGYRILVIENYAPASIEMSDIRLLFKDKKLVNISTQPTYDILDVLTIKYGKPTMSTRESEIICTLPSIGVKIIKKATTLSNRWEDKELRASFSVRTNISESNCKEYHVTDLSMEIKKDYDGYFSKNFEARINAQEEESKRKSEEKLKSLTEF